MPKRSNALDPVPPQWPEPSEAPADVDAPAVYHTLRRHGLQYGPQFRTGSLDRPSLYFPPELIYTHPFFHNVIQFILKCKVAGHLIFFCCFLNFFKTFLRAGEDLLDFRFSHKRPTPRLQTLTKVALSPKHGLGSLAATSDEWKAFQVCPQPLHRRI